MNVVARIKQEIKAVQGQMVAQRRALRHCEAPRIAEAAKSEIRTLRTRLSTLNRNLKLEEQKLTA
jgi:hypothetical protein